jgi:AP-1 complex subunit mu
MSTANPNPQLILQSLIQRSYRDDIPPSYIERFLPLVLDMEEDNIQVTPCFSDEGINYMHIRHNNLYREHSHRYQVDR